MHPPINDAIVTAVAALFADDPVSVRDPDAKPRDPSHQQLTEKIDRAGLSQADIRKGKEKRVRAVLDWALENDPDRGRSLIPALIGVLKGCGGFRSESPNYVGEEACRNAQDAFASEGWTLGSDGVLAAALVNDNLEGPEVTVVLRGYIRRAQRGSQDDALVIGTGKDLLEATAAHVLVERYGSYDRKAPFPSLLGLAFVAFGLAVPNDTPSSDEAPRKKLERGLYELGCAVNQLRNKAGVGHGRPFAPEVGAIEGKLAVQSMAMVSELLLDALARPRAS